MADRFEDMLERLGAQGRQAIANTYQLYQDGLIDLGTFRDVASELLQHVNELGATYGRMSYEQVAAFIADQQPDMATAAAARPTVSTSTAGISESLQTILDGDPEQILMRLERLGYVLPIQVTQDGYAAGLQSDQRAEGWTRGMNDNACQLCVWWWREGRIWPKRHPLQTHNGCKCQQVPKIGEVTSTQYTRALDRRDSAISNRDRRSQQVRRAIRAGELQS